MLLPQLEREGLYNSFNFNVDNCVPNYYFAANSSAIGARVEVFLCPSDGAEPPAKEWGGTNYVTNFGTEWDSFNVTNGVFHILSSTSVRDIVDGTCNTAAFSEHAMGIIGSGNPSHRLAHLRQGLRRSTRSLNQADLELWCATPNPSDGIDTGNYGTLWAWRHSDYRHVLSPNHRFCTEARFGVPIVYGGVGFSYQYLNPATSFHPNGVNLLLCDGSVRFIKDSISRGVWQALGTRAGQETIANTEF